MNALRSVLLAGEIKKKTTLNYCKNISHLQKGKPVLCAASLMPLGLSAFL